MNQYAEYLDRFLGENQNRESLMTMHPYSTFTYDAVWTIALALNKTQEELEAMNKSLEDFEYSNHPTVQNDMSILIQKYMNETNFPGVSVSVFLCYISVTSVNDIVLLCVHCIECRAVLFLTRMAPESD